MRFLAAVFAAVTLSAAAAPVLEERDYVEHERAEGRDGRLLKRDLPPRDILVPMRIGLTQGNLHRGHDLLMDISKHDSPNYGKHYTAEEVHDLFAPSLTAVQAVKAWVESAGIPGHRISQSINKQWIQFDANLNQVEDLLRAQYHLYDHHEDPDKKILATDCYSVPKDIQEHIDFIMPGIRPLMVSWKRDNDRKELSRRQPPVKKNPYFSGPTLRPLTPLTQHSLLEAPFTNGSISVCGLIVTPDCIKKVHKIPDNAKSAPDGSTLGIFESAGFYYSQADMDKFYRTAAPNVPTGTRPTPNSVDGAPFIDDITAQHGETNLDFQIVIPIVYPQKTVLWNVDDRWYQENTSITTGYFNTFLDSLDGSYCSTIEPGDPKYPDPHDSPYAYKGNLECGVYKPTNVISLSYSLQESSVTGMFFQEFPIKYQTRQCNEYLKLGLQGVSIIVSSADQGVAPKGEQCWGKNHTIFAPGFPSNCPYVTSVGATTLVEDEGGLVQRATTTFSSGGGFSNIYATPDYQKAAVQNYFNHWVPDYPFYETVNNLSVGANGGIYNRAGRGYPDVSALGQGILVVDTGVPSLADGTSASTPLFAAIITRINDERIKLGKKTLGFINPTIYAHPEVFDDITVGSNPGPAGRCKNLEQTNDSKGFPASPGWDPVTGLGSPDYQKLAAVLTALK